MYQKDYLVPRYTFYDFNLRKVQFFFVENVEIVD